jgi:hypothetical protein
MISWRVRIVCGSHTDTVTTTSRRSQAVVELLAAYSHSAQAAGLRLCHTAARTSPVCAPETEREAPVAQQRRTKNPESPTPCATSRDDVVS